MPNNNGKPRISLAWKLLAALLVMIALVAVCKRLAHKEHLMPEKVVGVANFSRTFNDLNDVQMLVAQEYGIEPLETREEVESMSSKLVKLEENKYYAVDELKYSVPYLTPAAEECLYGISKAFADSLKRKRYPEYKLVVTSVLRTTEDVNKLRRGNINATANSTHRYATTFDISWKTYKKAGKGTAEPETLKLILAEVLRDQQKLQNCYVKYEKNEACFHITSRIPSKSASRKSRRK